MNSNNGGLPPLIVSKGRFECDNVVPPGSRLPWIHMLGAMVEHAMNDFGLWRADRTVPLTVRLEPRDNENGVEVGIYLNCSPQELEGAERGILAVCVPLAPEDTAEEINTRLVLAMANSWMDFGASAARSMAEEDLARGPEGSQS